MSNRNWDHFKDIITAINKLEIAMLLKHTDVAAR